MARPFIYDAEKHPKELIEYMSKGWHDCQIYNKWKITRETFTQWKKVHEEFKEAYELGEGAWDAFYVEKAQECWAKGDRDGFKYFQSLMKKKENNRWTDNTDKNAVTNNYQIGNMNVLQAKSNPELLEILQQKLKTLSQYQDIKVIDVKPD